MPSQASSGRIDELRARFKAEPNSRHFYPLGEELRKLGQLDEAEQILRAGIVKHPAYLSAWVSLGRVLKDQGRYPDALEALYKAFTIDPGNVVTARLLADTYLLMDDKVEAIKKYKLVHALLPADEELQALIEKLDLELNPITFHPSAAGSGAASLDVDEAPPPALEAAGQPTIAAEFLSGESGETPPFESGVEIEAPGGALDAVPSVQGTAASEAIVARQGDVLPGQAWEEHPTPDESPQPFSGEEPPPSVEESELFSDDAVVHEEVVPPVSDDDIFSQTIPRGGVVPQPVSRDDDVFTADIAPEEPAGAASAPANEFERRRQTIARLQTWLSTLKGGKTSV